jgi:hypothetical protein
MSFALLACCRVLPSFLDPAIVLPAQSCWLLLLICTEHPVPFLDAFKPSALCPSGALWLSLFACAMT